MFQQVKLLKETYKTHDGASKRCRFENAIAKSEYDRGYKSNRYYYAVCADSNGAWRVSRNVMVTDPAKILSVL